jgi:hypothetical protein
MQDSTTTDSTEASRKSRKSSRKLKTEASTSSLLSEVTDTGSVVDEDKRYVYDLFFCATNFSHRRKKSKKSKKSRDNEDANDSDQATDISESTPLQKTHFYLLSVEKV